MRKLASFFIDAGVLDGAASARRNQPNSKPLPTSVRVPAQTPADGRSKPNNMLSTAAARSGTESQQGAVQIKKHQLRQLPAKRDSSINVRPGPALARMRSITAL